LGPCLHTQLFTAIRITKSPTPYFNPWKLVRSEIKYSICENLSPPARNLKEFWELKVDPATHAAATRAAQSKPVLETALEVVSSKLFQRIASGKWKFGRRRPFPFPSPSALSDLAPKRRSLESIGRPQSDTDGRTDGRSSSSIDERASNAKSFLYTYILCQQ
jgi:hypothetical protein